MKKGYFISLEGTEGTGKTTQANLIKRYLKAKGYKVKLTREPGGPIISEKIREILLNPEYKEMTMWTEVFLYLAARNQHVHQIIKPAVEKGEIIICDRFEDSTFAYQGGGRNINLDLLIKINNVAVENFHPVLTFVFVADVEQGLKKAIDSSKKENYSNGDRLEQETLDFHKRVLNMYITLSKKFKHIKIIDVQTKEKTFEQVKKHLDKLIK